MSQQETINQFINILQKVEYIVLNCGYRLEAIGNRLLLSKPLNNDLSEWELYKEFLFDSPGVRAALMEEMEIEASRQDKNNLLKFDREPTTDEMIQASTAAMEKLSMEHYDAYLKTDGDDMLNPKYEKKWKKLYDKYIRKITTGK